MRDATKEDTVKLLDAIFALNPPAKTRTIFRNKIGSSQGYRKLEGVVIEACIPVLLREQVIESVDSIIGGPHADIGSLSSFLDLAVCSGDARAVKAVLNSGANPNGVLLNTPNPRRSYPLLRAMNNHNGSVVRVLLEHGADPLAGYGKLYQGLPPGHKPWSGKAWKVWKEAMKAQGKVIPFHWHRDYPRREAFA
jgi:hypothetical protein